MHSSRSNEGSPDKQAWQNQEKMINYEAEQSPYVISPPPVVRMITQGPGSNGDRPRKRESASFLELTRDMRVLNREPFRPKQNLEQILKENSKIGMHGISELEELRQEQQEILDQRDIAENDPAQNQTLPIRKAKKSILSPKAQTVGMRQWHIQRGAPMIKTPTGNSTVLNMGRDIPGNLDSSKNIFIDSIPEETLEEYRHRRLANLDRAEKKSMKLFPVLNQAKELYMETIRSNIADDKKSDMSPLLYDQTADRRMESPLRQFEESRNNFHQRNNSVNVNATGSRFKNRRLSPLLELEGMVKKESHSKLMLAQNTVTNYKAQLKYEKYDEQKILEKEEAAKKQSRRTRSVSKYNYKHGQIEGSTFGKIAMQTLSSALKKRMILKGAYGMPKEHEPSFKNTNKQESKASMLRDVKRDQRTVMQDQEVLAFIKKEIAEKHATPTRMQLGLIKPKKPPSSYQNPPSPHSLMKRKYRNTEKTVQFNTSDHDKGMSKQGLDDRKLTLDPSSQILRDVPSRIEDLDKVVDKNLRDSPNLSLSPQPKTNRANQLQNLEVKNQRTLSPDEGQRTMSKMGQEAFNIELFGMNQTAGHSTESAHGEEDLQVKKKRPLKRKLSRSPTSAMFQMPEVLEKLDKTKENAEYKQYVIRQQSGVFLAGAKTSAGTQKGDSFDEIRRQPHTINSYNNILTYLPNENERPRLSVLANFRDINRMIRRNFLLGAGSRAGLPDEEVKVMEEEDAAANQMTLAMKQLHQVKRFQSPMRNVVNQSASTKYASTNSQIAKPSNYGASGNFGIEKTSASNRSSKLGALTIQTSGLALN